MENNYRERLEALRELTELSLIENIKLYRLRKRAAKAEKFYKKYYEQAGVFSYSEDVEYNMREKKLENNMKKTWNEFVEVEHDSFSLKEFTDNALDNYIDDKGISRVRK